MKRLTKSQYELIAEVLKYYADDANASIEIQVQSGNYNTRADRARLDLLKSITLDFQQKFILSDTEFKPKQFLADCGITD